MTHNIESRIWMLIAIIAVAVGLSTAIPYGARIIDALTNPEPAVVVEQQ